MKLPFSFPRTAVLRFRFLVILALPSLLYAQTRYTITNLGNLGGGNLFPSAINASGAVVGSEIVTQQQATQPFLYSSGVFTRLPSLGSGTDLNDAKGINAAGTIIGTTFVVSSGAYRGWVISGGSLADLGTDSSANAINDAGTVVGTTSGGTVGFTLSGGARTPLSNNLGGTIFNIAAINASGVIVGTYNTPSGALRAFRHAGGAMTDLGSLGTGRNSYGYGINAAGVVVGSTNNPASTEFHAFVLSGGTMLDLDPPGTTSTVFGSAAYGINSTGTVVGTYAVARAFVYTAAGGIVDLNTAVVNLSTSGFTQLREAYAINDAGQIVGRGNLAAGGFGAFRLDLSTIPAAPTIVVGPQPHVVAPGSSVVFSVVATSTALSYEWRFNNAPIGGATGASYSIPSAAAANAGNYSVRVFNEGGTVTSAPAALTVTSGVAGRLINLSILSSLTGGGDSLTMGYVVGGAGTSGSKPLVIRAVGPSLTPLGVPGALSDPKLELFVGPTKSGENDNWGGGGDIASAMSAVGAFAFTGPTSRDAAVTTSIAAGNNSVIVSPVGAISGAVLAELYESTPPADFTAATARLVNVSVLKSIGTGITAGFVVGGAASKTVLVRAVGPTLATAPFNVGGVVADPQLTLFSGPTKIGENNDWGGTPALTAAFTQVGAFSLPAASRDAAVLVTLAPGSYTVQVSGVNNSTGVALIEVYEVP